MASPRPARMTAPVYVVFWRKRWHSGSARKYLTVHGRGFTENRWKAWRTTDINEASRRAQAIEDGEFAEWKP